MESYSLETPAGDLAIRLEVIPALGPRYRVYVGDRKLDHYTTLLQAGEACSRGDTGHSALDAAVAGGLEIESNPKHW